METANYQNSSMVRGAATAMRDVAAAAPISPVQSQLQRQRELLSELEGSTDGLIDPLRTALERDPREVKVATAVSSPGQPSSCELEAILMGSNERLNDVIERVRQIRNAIRL